MQKTVVVVAQLNITKELNRGADLEIRHRRNLIPLSLSKGKGFRVCGHTQV